MKKASIFAALFLMMGIAAQAQNYMVVNSETIFKSIEEYTKAMKEVDDLGKQYQKNVDEAFEKIEEMFNNYQAQRPYLSESTRAKREEVIIENEKTVNEYQQKVFGQDGELMKKRVELIKPIQDQVFAEITKFAKEKGFELVLDISTSPMILYFSESVDKTDEIIEKLKTDGFTIQKTEEAKEIKLIN